MGEFEGARPLDTQFRSFWRTGYCSIARLFEGAKRLSSGILDFKSIISSELKKQET